ncbi:hypothetical protein Lepto7376_0199 [[Leptolyngbya] sp. PCC 7376]|uniref:DUF3465 domain-containing protein n=1 Tax=[Leptolyngbya] sp. PCC 7376 TaxID=111781 RepID=UPI00029F49ED|nr:DUF3465 domain-containing protein [[Leptolyngbya] sp. PCC 7376]AFY36644.1 hypothetical protein Lepto7376_0199 [[Leptolyngbya] sp. PCC 7376]
MRKVLPFILAIALLSSCAEASNLGTSSGVLSTPNSDEIIATAFETQQGDLQVEGQGHVIKLLPDDLKGSKHQRFIIELASGQTVLIAHNIDLAQKIDSLKEGDLVEFYGEYEWNPEGGVIHWTHHDPAGKHVDGWLKHQGILYL